MENSHGKLSHKPVLLNGSARIDAHGLNPALCELALHRFGAELRSVVTAQIFRRARRSLYVSPY